MGAYTLPDANWVVFFNENILHMFVLFTCETITIVGSEYHHWASGQDVLHQSLRRATGHGGFETLECECLVPFPHHSFLLSFFSLRELRIQDHRLVYTELANLEAKYTFKFSKKHTGLIQLT